MKNRQLNYRTMLTQAQLRVDLDIALENKPADIYRCARRLFFSMKVGQQQFIQLTASQGQIRSAAADIARIDTLTTMNQPRTLRSHVDMSDSADVRVFTRVAIPHDDICRELALSDFYISSYSDYRKYHPHEPAQLPPQFSIYRDYLVGAAWNIRGLLIDILEHMAEEPIKFQPREYGTCIETASSFLWIGLGVPHEIESGRIIINDLAINNFG